jgi:hypothetical protein
MKPHLLKYIVILGLLPAASPALAAYDVPGPKEVAAELAYRQMADDYSSALLCEPGVRREANGQVFRCVNEQ